MSTLSTAVPALNTGRASALVSATATVDQRTIVLTLMNLKQNVEVLTIVALVPVLDETHRTTRLS